MRRRSSGSDRGRSVPAALRSRSNWFILRVVRRRLAPAKIERAEGENGAAERGARPGRRHGVFGHRMLRRRNPHPEHRSAGARRGQVFSVLQHGTVQSVPRVAAHRAPPAPDGHRHPDQRRSAAWISGHHQRALRHAGRSAEGRGVRHLPFRQVAPRLRNAHAERRMAHAPRLRPLFWHADRMRFVLPAGHADARRGERRARGARSRLLLHRCDHRRGVRVHPGHARRPPRAAVLPLRRLHGAALAAPFARGGRGEISRDVRRGLGRAARTADAAAARARHPRRQRGAERARQDAAGLERRRVQGVAGAADGSLRRADRPDGQGSGPDRRHAGTRCGARRHAGDLPVRQWRVRRSAAARQARAFQGALGHPPGQDTRRTRSARRQRARRLSPAARTPTRAMAARGRICRTRHSATTSGGCTKAESPRPSSSTGPPEDSARARSCARRSS